MAKTSFKDNSALQFISAAQPREPALEPKPVPEPNPTQPEKNPPEGYKPNPLYMEKKTRRLQASVPAQPLRVCEAPDPGPGVSLNEYVFQVLDKAGGEAECLFLDPSPLVPVGITKKMTKQGLIFPENCRYILCEIRIGQFSGFFNLARIRKFFGRCMIMVSTDAASIKATNGMIAAPPLKKIKEAA